MMLNAVNAMKDEDPSGLAENLITRRFKFKFWVCTLKSEMPKPKSQKNSTLDNPNEREIEKMIILFIKIPFYMIAVTNKISNLIWNN